MLLMAEKVMEVEKKKKKGWFWSESEQSIKQILR